MVPQFNKPRLSSKYDPLRCVSCHLTTVTHISTILYSIYYSCKTLLLTRNHRISLNVPSIISQPEIKQLENTVGMVIDAHRCRFSISPSYIKSSHGLIPKIAQGLSLPYSFCLLQNNDFTAHLCEYLCCCHGQNVSIIPASSPKTEFSLTCVAPPIIPFAGWSYCLNCH